MDKLFIEKGDKKLRMGFTTGSCAAAASKAALIMLLTKTDIHNVSIMTPKGIAYNAEIVGIEKKLDNGFVSCAVIKDGGDDPDVTTGSMIYAKVELKNEPGIVIDGGEGVGRVTKPGLDQPIGEAAINSVPRKMITENISAVLKEYEQEDKGVIVTISVPGGDELAKKTFNPKLGIVGGISILGTTGIVEPMSDDAIVQTIKTEIRVRKAEGKQILMVAPGNYGITFLSEVYGIDEKNVVMTSNFIYDTVRLALDEGFTKILFTGHIGKLVKVAGGIKNTHSRYGDHRMEILTDLSKRYMSETDFDKVKDTLPECVMTGEAVRIINETGHGDIVFDKMAENIKEYMEKWSDGNISVEVIVFSGENEELVSTENAHTWIKEI
jgi:cobalt-precorrin-5B (C1)-methyltransferase